MAPQMNHGVAAGVPRGRRRGPPASPEGTAWVAGIGLEKREPQNYSTLPKCDVHGPQFKEREKNCQNGGND